MPGPPDGYSFAGRRNMGWWLVNADTLARSRFVISPLAEATASLLSLHRRRAGYPGEQAWLDTHVPAYRERPAGDPVTALLIRPAPGPHRVADLLLPAPARHREARLAEEAARPRGTPPPGA